MSSHEANVPIPCDGNACQVGILEGQAMQHDTVESQKDHAVQANEEEVGILEGQAMQHDTVEPQKDHAVQTNEEESSGKLADSSNLKKELLEAVHEFLVARHQNERRPLPVLLQGKEVDLLMLCMQVRACGGYDKATGSSMWSFISESLGFGCECGPSLKLVYVKYLKALESWTLLATEDVKNMLQSELPLHPSCTKVYHWVSRSTEVSVTSILRSGNAAVGANSIPGPSEGYQGSYSETPPKRKRLTHPREGHLMDNSVIEQQLMSLKGSESLTDVLEWLKRLAVNPGDLKKGQGPRGSKQNEAWVENCVVMASKIRAVLWRRKELASFGQRSGLVQQKKQRHRKIP